jgi:predicted PurR-regulated permease PerM
MDRLAGSPRRGGGIGPGEPGRAASAVPTWTLRALATSTALLASAGVLWLLLWLLLRVPLLTVAASVSALLAALLAPVARRLCDRGVPPAVAALLTVLVLLGVLVGVGLLVGLRTTGTFRDLTGPLAAGVDRIRLWLVDGPLQLDPQQVTEMRDAIVSRVYELAPQPVAAARTAFELLAAVLLVVFLVFFLLKDRPAMWAWLLRMVPTHRREQVDGAGRGAWDALSHYARGVVVVALVDAVGIGVALLVLGVPLWGSLTLLTFLGAFVPLFGATISGAVAVLVTLVTNGFTDAIIVLVVVLAVQQIEGNVLQPLIVGRAVHLHPIVVLLSVTAGTLLWGLAGAVLAVPLVAAGYQVLEYVRDHPAGPASPVREEAVDSPSGVRSPAPGADGCR